MVTGRSGLIETAERELSALFFAVKERFGAEQAEASAEDWLRALAARNDLPSTAREWRTLVIAATVQLARRVNALAAASADSV